MIYKGLVCCYHDTVLNTKPPNLFLPVGGVGTGPGPGGDMGSGPGPGGLGELHKQSTL